jgi:hypothetical protein
MIKIFTQNNTDQLKSKTATDFLTEIVLQLTVKEKTPRK